MTQPIRFVFLDIDGTLVHRRRLIKSAAVSVTKVMDRGIEVALCTGRSVLHALPVQRRLGVQHAVYFNGGLARTHQETVRSSPLESSVVHRVIHYVERKNLPMILHTDTEAITLHDIPSEHEPLLHEYDYPKINRLDEQSGLVALPQVYQTNVFVRPEHDDTIAETFPECLVYRWASTAIDLQKRGCDKSLGAIDILKRFGIPPEHALHIGDGGNDIGMFHTVGMSVAMGNAPLEVQQHAQMVTSDVERDGVHSALQKLGLI